MLLQLAHRLQNNFFSATFTLTILIFSFHAHAFILVQKGQPRVRIVIASDAQASVKFAASQLQLYIQKSSGATLKIVTKSSPQTNLANIYLGDIPQARAAGFNVGELVADGSMRGVVNGNLYILGRDQACLSSDWNRSIHPVDAMKTEHGTLFGVYDFLENFVGIRWYLPGKIGQVIPKQTTIQVPDARVTDQPVFTDRWFVSPDFLYYHNKNASLFPDAKDYVSDTQEIYKWIMRLRWSTQITVQGSHSAHFLNYGQRFGKNHPQWFAQLPNGERAIDTPRGAYLCWSQAGLVDEMIKDAKAFYAGKSASTRGIKDWRHNRFGKYFMLDPNDGYPGCFEPICQKAVKDSKEGDYSEIIFAVIAKVANAIKNIPGARITTLAYPPKLFPPQKVKLPSNVSVRLCIAGPNVILRPLANQKQMQLIKDWSKRLDGDLTLWTYSNAPQYQRMTLGGSVQTLPHAISTFLRESRPYIQGMFYQNGQSTQTNRNLDTYVAMKLLWNPDLDIDALLSEYYQKLYGPAGDAVAKFYQRLEEDWKTISTFHPEPTHNLYWYDRQPGTASRIELWEKILNADELHRLDALLTKAQQAVKKSPSPIYAQRVALLRQWTYGTMLSYRSRFLEELGSKDRVSVSAYRNTIPTPKNGILPAKAWKGLWQKMVSVSKKHPTEVGSRFQVLHDEKYLYLLVELDEPLMDRSATMADRKNDDGNLWRDNDIEIMIDPHDQTGAIYKFLINDQGKFTDLKKQFGNYNVGWNSQAQWQVKNISSGWQVQLAIPLKSLGLTKKTSRTPLGFNVVRHRAIRDQADQFYGWCPSAILGRWNDPILWGVLRLEPFTGQSRELLINGDMEAADHSTKNQTPAGWVVPRKSQPYVVLDSQVKAGGKRSVRIKHDQIQDTVIAQYFPNPKPNTTYRLRCKIKTKNISGTQTNPGHSGVYLQFYAPGFNRFIPNTPLRGDHDWRTVELTIKTASKLPDKPVMYLRLRLRDASGTVWFDDASLQELFQ